MTKALLFDFDGTLADTVEGIVLTMRQTMVEMGRPVPSDEAIIQTIGLPLVSSVQLLGDFSDEETIVGVETYRRLFPTYELEHITLFPNVVETIMLLREKGFRLAICTSRGAGSLSRIMSRYGIYDQFETMVTASDNLPAKPAPDIVLEILRRMNLSPDDAIVIGDTTFDLGMGKSAGCRTCAVTYGNHSREKLESMEPDWIIDGIEELVAIATS